MEVRCTAVYLSLYASRYSTLSRASMPSIPIESPCLQPLVEPHCPRAQSSTLRLGCQLARPTRATLCSTNPYPRGSVSTQALFLDWPWLESQLKAMLKRRKGISKKKYVDHNNKKKIQKKKVHLPSYSSSNQIPVWSPPRARLEPCPERSTWARPRALVMPSRCSSSSPLVTIPSQPVSTIWCSLYA